MPTVVGWKIKPRDIGKSYYYDGALAWQCDGEEGRVIEMSTTRSSTLAKAAKAYAKAPTADNADGVNVAAVNLAANELAPHYAAEPPRRHHPIRWRGGAKAALIARAEEIADAAVKAALIARAEEQ